MTGASCWYSDDEEGRKKNEDELKKQARVYISDGGIYEIGYRYWATPMPLTLGRFLAPFLYILYTYIIYYIRITCIFLLNATGRGSA